MKFNAKKVKKIVFKLIIFGLIACVIYIFLNQYIKIKNKSNELSETQHKISVQKEKNREIRNRLNNGSEDDENASGGQKAGAIVFENVTE